MYFGLNDERKLLQATLREFAAKELPPARLRRSFDEGSGDDLLGERGLGLPRDPRPGR